jgi:hypothetical protein
MLGFVNTRKPAACHIRDFRYLNLHISCIKCVCGFENEVPVLLSAYRPLPDVHHLGMYLIDSVKTKFQHEICRNQMKFKYIMQLRALKGSIAVVVVIIITFTDIRTKFLVVVIVFVVVVTIPLIHLVVV